MVKTTAAEIAKFRYLSALLRLVDRLRLIFDARPRTTSKMQAA